VTPRLAIFTPDLGVRSETFIRRHVDDLWPGHCVVVTGMSGRLTGPDWKANCPVLDLSQQRNLRLRQQVVRSILGKAGWTLEEPEIRRVRAFLVRHEVNVAMGEYLDVSLPWLKVCRDLGIAFWGHGHGYDVSRLLRDDVWRRAYLQYRDAAGVVVVSEVSRKRLVDLGLNAERVHVVPCGVEVGPLVQRQDRRGEPIRCLAVGRMVAKKAPILCLDAFRRAAERMPNLRLTYVGAGELLPAARHFVKAFGLGDRVSLLGGQSSEVVQRLMAEADVFVQHSVVDEDTGDEEGLPVAILEAMAQGLPVVSTRHAGIPEAVIDHGTGLLVDEGDSIGMADGLVELAGDAGLRQRLGEAGWQRAKAMFSWEQERGRLLKIMGLVDDEDKGEV